MKKSERELTGEKKKKNRKKTKTINYSGIRAKTTKTEESFFVSKYGLIVLIFHVYDYL